MPVILGIDPGSRITGVGVIRYHKNQLTYVTSGCIRTKGDRVDEKLTQIYDGVSQIIEQTLPDEVAIEQVFMARNPDSALKLGQARGVAIVAAAKHALQVAEYSARQIKQAVVGTGAAKKEQVQHMVCSLLKLDESPQADAADALAVAICHVHSAQSLMHIAGASRTRRKRVR